MPTLTDNLRHLLKHGTTAIDPSDWDKINDLWWFGAVKRWKSDGKCLLMLTKRKGAKSRVKEFINHNKIILQ